ncbi:hypothetical protein [Actinomadura sp. 7K507]|uniref:hypothetical protein n=1 Tax=Actinomadura sp. 7K507 TaxID=2530365 RepID=UPI001049B557|nr:hypothetical protein [Actinomadura sp. 7K507]TDC97250.1 hypothetical protein E1285_03915 [Actinomadura sp. 7K507]
MDDAVTLLLIRHLFPGWTITREEGAWCATLSSPDADGLLGKLAAADPGLAERAVSLLAEKR